MQKKHKILLIEAEIAVMNIFALKFEEKGFEVYTRANPDDEEENFVNYVSKLKPDLISMGVLFEGRNGFEAISLLKSDQRTSNIPVVFLTNYGSKEAIQEGKSLGAEEYFVMVDTLPKEFVEWALAFLKERLKGRNYTIQQQNNTL